MTFEPLRYVSTMRDSSRKITRWLNFLMQYEFEVHHREGRSRELIVPDILSRMMLDVKMSDEERQAQMMERPIIRYYEGYSSPILTSWFCVFPLISGHPGGIGARHCDCDSKVKKHVWSRIEVFVIKY